MIEMAFGVFLVFPQKHQAFDFGPFPPQESKPRPDSRQEPYNLFLCEIMPL